MSSSKWGVVCSLIVEEFRRALLPEDLELFNECLMRIYRDPRVDRIHKFTSFSRPPLVYFMYRDDNFVLIYLWEHLSDPFDARRITVSHAMWTRDFNSDSTIPRH